MRKSLLLLLLLASSSCVPVATYDPAAQQERQRDAKANAQAQVDRVMLQRIERARIAAKAGGTRPAWTFAKEVENAYQTKMVERGTVDGPALVNEAIGYLDTAPDGDQALAAKGSLLISVGRREEGIAALEESFKTPNLWPVGKLLEVKADRPLEIVVICKKARGVTKTDDERYALLDQCKHWGKDLAWASKDDIAFYERQRAADEARAREEAAAYRRKQEDDRQRMEASFQQQQQQQRQQSSSSVASSGPSSVSVTIRTRCPKTVRIFYGDKPKFGSGTTSSISSNSIQSHSFRPGDQMWIVDESDNGVSNASVSANTHEIEISSSCTGLMTR